MMVSENPLKILILEDSILDVDLIRAKIKQNFYFEDSVVYGREAFINEISRFKPDIILSDYSMPQFNGLEALEILQNSEYSCPFIIITGALDEETAVSCIKAGANDYLVKDRLIRLPSAIRQSLQQHKITNEKEATQKALEESIRNFLSLGKASPDYVLLITRDGNVKYSNRDELFSIKIRKGQNIYDKLNNVLGNNIKVGIEEAFLKGKNKAFTTEIFNKNKIRFFYRCKISHVFSNDDYSEFMLLLNDITDVEEVKIDMEISHLRLTELLNRLESIRDDEKKRISLEIHDQLGQELTAAKLGLFYLKKQIDKTQKSVENLNELKLKIDSLIELSGNTIQTVRRIAHQLRPIILDDLGLIPALERMIKNFNENTDISWRLKLGFTKEEFNKDFSLSVYRVVQEAITNVIRHSNASSCIISFSSNEDRFLINISDNGNGFDPKLIRGKGKLGLFGIEERIKPWKGDIEIESEKGKGCIVKVSFPKKLIIKTHD